MGSSLVGRWEGVGTIFHDASQRRRFAATVGGRTISWGRGILVSLFVFVGTEKESFLDLLGWTWHGHVLVHRPRYVSAPGFFQWGTQVVDLTSTKVLYMYRLDISVLSRLAVINS